MYATGRAGHARSRKLTAGGERLVMSRSCGLDHPAFATKKVRTVMTIATVPATKGHCQAVVMPMMLGD